MFADSCDFSFFYEKQRNKSPMFLWETSLLVKLYKEVMFMIVCLSVRLKELRINKNLTQAQVAQYVGVTRAVISAYETDIRQPSYDILIRLALLYGVTTDYLLCIDSKRYLDISGLSEREAAAVCEMVNVFMENKKK